jgi:hypothetical protein
VLRCSSITHVGHLTGVLLRCLQSPVVQKTFSLKDRGPALVHRLLAQLATSNLDVLEHNLQSLRLISVSCT